MISYISTRRRESTNWVNKYIPNAEIHWLNVPDQLDLTNLQSIYGNNIFENINNCSIPFYLVEKLINIVGDNIIISPSNESHPSHLSTFMLCDLLPNKRIYYSIHGILKKNISREKGIYYYKTNIIGFNFHNYYVVYSEDELKQKNEEFENYYQSQYLDFKRTGLKITNWEHYLSEIPLILGGENEIKILTDKTEENKNA